MGINLNYANAQATQLLEYAEQLKDAKKKLQSYKTELSVNWTGTETQHIYAGVDKAILKLDTIINELNSLQNDIKNTASQIRQEEIAREEAAKKAAEEKAAREAAEKAAQEEATRKATEEKKVSETKKTTSSKPNSKSNSKTNSNKDNSLFGWIANWF